uniref:Uncharacterized protein n=1 Tax=Anguilla anguilla TaxID=7936 RepID=A0A0E9UF49_ANGAN
MTTATWSIFIAHTEAIFQAAGLEKAAPLLPGLPAAISGFQDVKEIRVNTPSVDTHPVSCMRIL